MTEHWDRLERLYHEAAALPHSERAVFVAGACGSDSRLRQDLEALLQHESTNFLDGDRLVVGGTLVGRRLGAYEILEVIGRGGMGDVYRARDLVLGRTVAVKVLPPEWLSHADRRARFESEARILASLNHPNIANVYELDASSGESALVMELVDGETLRERIHAGPTPLRDALELSIQMAAGLEAAHESGVVHRDFKPENIKVSPTGVVKILDFGIATIEPRRAPFTASDVTRTGEVVGTVAYMSPEQARGRAVDRRTDIWAFGCVLYELLTAAHPFGGATAADRMGAILQREPDWNRLSAAAPADLVRLIRRMLAKDPRERVRDAGDAALELRAILTEPPIRSAIQRRNGAVWLVLAGVAAGAIATAFGARLLRPPSTPPTNVAIPFPRGATHPPADAGAQIAVAPDGRAVSYVAIDATGRGRLYVQSFDTAEPRLVAGSEGARDPFFSADGKWLGFVSGEQFKKVALPDGAPQPLCSTDVKPSQPEWESDGTLVFAERGDAVSAGIVRVSPDCAHVEVLTRPDHGANELAHFAPHQIAGSPAILFTARFNTATGVRYQIKVLPRAGTVPRLLVDDGLRARYADGNLWYQRGTTIFAAPLDVQRWSVGPAHAVADNVDAAFVSGWDVVGSVLVYRPAVDDARMLTWVGRDGREEQIPAPPRRYFAPALSPRGDQIASEVLSGADVDIWMYDIARDALRRVTFDGVSRYPEWTPDGSRMTIARRRAASLDIYWLPIDGGTPELLKRNEQIAFVDSWTRDLRTMIYSQSTRTGSDLWTLERGSGVSRPLIESAPTKYAARLSPDQRWLAYVANVTGTFELFVTDYPSTRRQWQLTSGGAREPLWSREGRELFYRSGDDLFSIPIESVEPFVTGHPRRLFTGPYFKPGGPGIRSYDVAPDAQRFLMLRSAVNAPATLRVVFAADASSSSGKANR